MRCLLPVASGSKGSTPNGGTRSTAKPTIAPITLAPYESRVVVFTKERIAPDTRTPTATVVDMSSGWKVTFPGHITDMRRLALMDR